MTVADDLAAALAAKGIAYAYGIIGAGNIALWNAIARMGKIELVPCHHEQAAAMAAAYHVRTSGKVDALCLVTTGAGSSNAITGVIAAHMDHVPLVVISGNEASKYMGKGTRIWGVQGYNSSGVAVRFTKYANRVMKPELARPSLDAALQAVSAMPQGAAWLDIPKDIQNAEL